MILVFEILNFRQINSTEIQSGFRHGRSTTDHISPSSKISINLRSMPKIS